MFSDLEWKIIYVGSAESMDCDQVLETILVGPVPGGSHMFVFEVLVLAMTSTECCVSVCVWGGGGGVGG